MCPPEYPTALVGEGYIKNFEDNCQHGVMVFWQTLVLNFSIMFFILEVVDKTDSTDINKPLKHYDYISLSYVRNKVSFDTNFHFF